MQYTNPFTAIENELTQVDDILKESLPNYAVVREEISQKLHNQNLTIMFFGAYNAGKSTLINTLLGTNCAKIGDIPTTDKVDSYTWNNYQLIDTPGINAPIQHERISQAQLYKSDLIVFVIRKDDEDSASTYQQLFNLLNNDKEIFLVFNYSGLDANSTGDGSVALSIQQLNRIILREAKEVGISMDIIEKIQIIPINLKTALKGKLEHKYELLKHAGFVDFEQQFKLWLSHYNHKHQILKTLKDQIERQLLTPAEKNLSADENQELQSLVDQLDLLKSQQSLLMIEVETYIRGKVSSLVSIISSLIQDQKTSAVKAEIEKLYQEVENFIAQKIEHSITLIKSHYDNLSPAMPKSTARNKESDSEEILTKIAPIILVLPLPPKVKVFATVVLGVLKEFSKLFQSDDNTDAENAAREQQALQAAQQAKAIEVQLLASLLEESQKVLTASFQKSIDNIEKPIAQLKTTLDRKQNMKSILNESRIKINAISF